MTDFPYWQTHRRNDNLKTPIQHHYRLCHNHDIFSTFQPQSHHDNLPIHRNRKRWGRLRRLRAGHRDHIEGSWTSKPLQACPGDYMYLFGVIGALHHRHGHGGYHHLHLDSVLANLFNPNCGILIVYSDTWCIVVRMTTALLFNDGWIRLDKLKRSIQKLRAYMAWKGRKTERPLFWTRTQSLGYSCCRSPSTISLCR